MPPLMNLPAYQTPNALLNFSPLNEGIDSYRKGQDDVRRHGVAQGVGRDMQAGNYKAATANALMGDRADLAGVAMHAQQNERQQADADLNRQYKMIDRMGRIAAAAADDPNPENRAKAHQYLISQHPNRDGLDPLYLNPDTGLKMMAAEAGQHKSALEKQMEQAKLDLTRAQTHRYNAQAGAQTALANVRDGRAGPEAPSPLAGWGEDAEGNLVPPRGPAIPQGNRPQGAIAPADVPSDVAPAALPPGGAGRFSPNFTQVADKRSAPAIDGYGSGDDQKRLADSMAKRRALQEAFGKPPSGKAWNDRGGLVDLSVKDTANERAMRMHATAGLQTLKTAEDLLEKTGTLDQLAGAEISIPSVGKVGRFGEAGRGFNAARSAVLQLNFALSGKSVSNAEREEFQSIYMPSPFDGRDTQRFKIKQVRDFFNVVVNARKNGMDDDMIAELYRQSIAEGTKGATPQQKIDPTKQRLMNKYGLE